MPKKTAFSLFELSIVILIIGIIVAGISSMSYIVDMSFMANAQKQTINSPVQNMNSAYLWLETTLENSLEESEKEDSDMISVDGVSVWHDINPRAIRKKTITSPTSANYPKFYQNCINELPCLRFDGNDDYFIVDNFSLENSDYSIFVVEQRRSSGNNPFFGKNSSTLNNSAIEAGYNSNNTIFLSQGSGQNNAYNFSPSISNFSSPKARLHSFINSTLTSGSSTAKHFLNGHSPESASSLIGSFSSITNFAKLTIALNKTSSLNYFNGDLGEIIIFDKALSELERTSVEQYLISKWHIKD